MTTKTITLIVSDEKLIEFITDEAIEQLEDEVRDNNQTIEAITVMPMKLNSDNSIDIQVEVSTIREEGVRI